MEQMGDDILFYYSGSRDARVGEGVHEYVRNVNNYAQLSQARDWRKVLSNFYEHHFYWLGHWYNTAEHAYQAAKFENINHNLAFQFTLDSGTQLSQSPGIEARKLRKVVQMNQHQISQWNSISEVTMESILVAKFSSSQQLGNVLLYTCNAQLWHGGPRIPARRMVELERVREMLRNGT